MIGSAVSVLIAMTWGGIEFPWNSAHVLTPLVVGGIGMLSFFAYEKFFGGHTVGALWIRPFSSHVSAAGARPLLYESYDLCWVGYRSFR